jgi:hypothetical protein
MQKKGVTKNKYCKVISLFQVTDVKNEFQVRQFEKKPRVRCTESGNPDERFIFFFLSFFAVIFVLCFFPSHN